VGVLPAKTSTPASSAITTLASLGVLLMGTVCVGVPMMLAQPLSVTMAAAAMMDFMNKGSLFGLDEKPPLLTAAHPV
jgi:hypothetical protein